MRRVSWPGFALLLVGTVYVGMSLIGLWGVTSDAAIRGLTRGGQIFDLGLFAIQLALGVVMLMGGSKMRNLQGYRYALAAAIAAMVPTPCSCLLGFPFGLWACIVLLDARVKAAFRR